MPRGPEFRSVYTNAIAYGISDHDVKIVFAIMEDPNDIEASIDQVGVHMTLKTAKLLSFMLSETIAAQEKVLGVEIPLDPKKMTELRGLIEDGSKGKAKKAAL